MIRGILNVDCVAKENGRHLGFRLWWQAYDEGMNYGVKPMLISILQGRGITN